MLVTVVFKGLQETMALGEDKDIQLDSSLKHVSLYMHRVLLELLVMLVIKVKWYVKNYLFQHFANRRILMTIYSLSRVPKCMYTVHVH